MQTKSSARNFVTCSAIRLLINVRTKRKKQQQKWGTMHKNYKILHGKLVVPKARNRFSKTICKKSRFYSIRKNVRSVFTENKLQIDRNNIINCSKNH